MLGDRLRDLMLKCHKSQQQVSNELGITRQRLNFYVTGRRQPDNEMLLVLAEYFEVSIDYLLGKTDKKNKPTANNGDELPKEMQEFMSFYDELDEDRQRKLLEIARLYRDDQRKTSDNK